MLTAYAEEADKITGLDCGADDYLTKPFGMEELKARIRSLFRRMEINQGIVDSDGKISGEIVSYRSIVLDPLRCSVSVDGESSDLTPTELSLLKLLLSNPGRTFSRTYLLDLVWNETTMVGDRAVDNAILRLRKKLKTRGDVIETVWGMGYRLGHE